MFEKSNHPNTHTIRLLWHFCNDSNKKKCVCSSKVKPKSVFSQNSWIQSCSLQGRELGVGKCDLLIYVAQFSSWGETRAFGCNPLEARHLLQEVEQQKETMLQNGFSPLVRVNFCAQLNRKFSRKNYFFQRVLTRTFRQCIQYSALQARR